jgi:hypothetical protein
METEFEHKERKKNIENELFARICAFRYKRNAC